MTTNQKRLLESEFPLFQTSSVLFSFIQFVKCWRNSLCLNAKGPHLSLEKENFCTVFTNSIERAREIRKFHVAVVQRRLRNVQKGVMHVQSCCFANINQSVFCRSLVVVHCCDLELLLSWQRDVTLLRHLYQGVASMKWFTPFLLRGFKKYGCDLR